jgi:hypothetical protein
MASPQFSFPCKVSNNRKYFVDSAGRPFFWLGDTAWALFCRADPDETLRYLDIRAKQGFTVLQAVVGWPDFSKPDPKPVTPNYAGELPWIDNNPSTPNTVFFSQVDFAVAEAQKRGITLAILPTWGQFITEEKLVNIENAYTYGSWLGARYRNAPDIVWINGGDILPQGFEDVLDALAQGLRDGDGGAHLITFHPVGWGSSAEYFHNRQWLDFNMIQTWSFWDRTWEGVITDLLMTPHKPVVVGEGAYEDTKGYPCGEIRPVMVRRQAWWTFMAGGFHTYGHCKVHGFRPGWLDHLESSGAGHMGVFKSIVSEFPWWDAVPDQGLIEVGRSADQTLNTAVRTTDRRLAMVYLSTHTHVLLRLGRLDPQKVKATWINPQNGERREAGVHTAYTFPGYRGVRNTAYQAFSGPDVWEDALLLLEPAGE